MTQKDRDLLASAINSTIQIIVSARKVNEEFVNASLAGVMVAANELVDALEVIDPTMTLEQHAQFFDVAFAGDWE